MCGRMSNESSRQDHQLASTREPRVVEGILHTGSVETPYRRAGRGRTLLLLLHGTTDARAEVFLALSREFRVIDPTPPWAGGEGPRPTGDRGEGSAATGEEDPPPGHQWSAWLLGVVDGLGLDRPALIVDAVRASLIGDLALTDPHRFGPVIVIRPGDRPESLVSAVRAGCASAAESDRGS